MKNLILEGFMGCGKSRIARVLGDDTGMEVIDTDALIEKEQKKQISDIYLKADRDILVGRLERGFEKRPMLSGHDLEKRVEELLAARKDFYDDAADVIIDIGEDDPDTISLRIRKELGL